MIYIVNNLFPPTQEVLDASNVPIYTYLGVNDHSPIDKNQEYYTTTFTTINNQKVNLQNRGVQGANVSNDWRYGVILTYSLGWLRQEENQYLDVPSEEVKKLSKDLARLIGYRAYGGLGFSINPEHFFLQEDSSYRD